MEQLARLWYRVSSTFWFVPTLIVTGATVLAVLMIEADARYVTASALEAWPRLFGAGPSASRSLLAAVAGSMITVAGTVFSITLVALSLASSQYSSRVLRNFMRDRTNQAVLGVFLGIFAYCLVVLRSIHGEGDDAFVPSVAVFLGLLLGFGGIGVLVVFIHHIAQSIQASQILDSVRTETKAAVDRLFPHDAEADADDPLASPSDQPWHEVRRADADGYVQFIAFEGLLELAHAHDVRLKVHPRIGQYVLEGDCLVSASPGAPGGLGDKLANCLTTGPQRTVEQDIAFGIRQLVDVGLKALSPSLNDTTTAIMCIDALVSILGQLASRDLRFEKSRRGDAGWVEVDDPRFEDLLDEAMDQVRHAACDNVAVYERLRWALGTLGARTALPGRRAALRRQAFRLQASVERDLRDPEDRNRLQAAITTLLRALGPVAME